MGPERSQSVANAVGGGSVRKRESGGQPPTVDGLATIS